MVIRFPCILGAVFIILAVRESGQMDADWSQRGTLAAKFYYGYGSRTNLKGVLVLPQPHHGKRMSTRLSLPSQLLKQRCLLQRERRRNSRTPFSRPVEVLQRDERGVDACKLRRNRVVEWERYLNGRIINSMACSHVRKEMLYVRIKVGKRHFLMGLLKALRLPG